MYVYLMYLHTCMLLMIYFYRSVVVQTRRLARRYLSIPVSRHKKPKATFLYFIKDIKTESIFLKPLIAVHKP